MGPLRKIQSDVNSNKIYEAPFEAFKFPTSAIVQFRALIVPCIQGDCHPVLCTIPSNSGSSSNLYGTPMFQTGSKTSVHSYGKRSVDEQELHLTLPSPVVTKSRPPLITSASFRQMISTAPPKPLTSDDEMILPDLMNTTIRELEERVFIEVLDKRFKVIQGEEGSTGDSTEPDSEASGLTNKSRNSLSDGHPDDLNEDDEENCMKIPIPWIIGCLMVLSVQLIALMRFFFSSRKYRTMNKSVLQTSTSCSASSTSSHFMPREHLR